MKKLLSILGTITIAGSGMAALVGNAPAPVKNEINYSQTNDLATLKREKREHYNKNEIYIWYRFLAHNGIQIRISNDTFNQISFNHDLKTKTEFENYLYLILKEFPFYNGAANAEDGQWYISNEDIWHSVYVISNHYEEILNLYNKKEDNNRGIKIITNRAESWEKGDSKYYGVFLDN